LSLAKLVGRHREDEEKKAMVHNGKRKINVGNRYQQGVFRGEMNSGNSCGIAKQEEEKLMINKPS
jgi:hypothetical protein